MSLSLSQRIQIAEAVLEGIRAVKDRRPARRAPLRLVPRDEATTAEQPAFTNAELVFGGSR